MSFKDKVVNLVLKGKDLFSPESKKTAKALSQLTDKAADLRGELSNLKVLERDLAKAGHLTQYAAESETALKEAREELTKTTNAYDELSVSSREQGLAVKKAATEAEKAEKAYQNLTDKLATQNKLLNEAGIDTKNLATAEIELQQSLAKVSNELKTLENAEKQLAKSAELEAHIKQSAAALKQAKDEVKQYASAIDASGKASAAQRSELKLSEQSVRRIAGDYERTQAKLSELNASMDEAGVSNKTLAEAQSELADKSKILNAELSKLQQQQKSVSAANQLETQLDSQKQKMLDTAAAAEELQQGYKETEIALEKSANAMKDSATIAGKAEANYLKLTRQLSEVKANLEKAGISTDDLAKAQKKLSGELNKTTEAIKQNKSKIKELAGTLGKLKEKTREAGSGAKELTRDFIALGATYFGIYELKNALFSLFATGGQFENYSAQLSAMYEDTAKGEAAFAWIRQFSRETPNSMDQVLDAFLMVKNNGMDPMDGTLRKLIAANARYGRGQETLIPIIRQMTQAWAKGRLTAEDAGTAIENGLPIWELLSNALGRSVEELRAMSEAGKIGRIQLQALFDEMESTSLATMEERMKGWNAQVVKFNDLWTEFKALIADSGVLDYFKEELLSINQTMTEMAQDGRLKAMAIEWADWIVSTAKSTRSFISSLVEDIDQFARNTSQFMGGLQIGFNAFTAGIKTVAWGVTNALAEMAESFTKMLSFVASDEMTAQAAKQAGALRAISEAFKNASLEDYEDIKNGYNKLTGETHEKVKKSYQDVATEAKKSGSSQKQAIDDLVKESEKSAGALDKQGEAFRTLGIKSAEVLGNMAKDAAAAYKTIKEGNQPLAQQEKAFLAWAEASLKSSAASGVQVEASLHQEAAALGLSQSLDGLIKKYFELDKAQAGSADKDKQQTSSFEKSSAAIKKYGKQIKDTVTDTKNSTADIAKHFSDIATAVQQNVAKLSDNAVSYFKSIMNQTTLLIDSSSELDKVTKEYDRLNGVIGDLNDRIATSVDFVGLRTWALETERAGKIAEQAYHGQKIELLKLTESLDGAKDGQAALIEKAERSAKSLELLNDQDLSKLTGAIDRAKDRLDSMRESADDTLSSLRDELDSLQGNELSIQQREYERKLSDIREQLKNAQSSGDADLLAQLKESERLLKSINDLRVQEIKAESAESANDNSQSTSQTSTSQTQQSQPTPAPQVPQPSAPPQLDFSQIQPSVSGDVVTFKMQAGPVTIDALTTQKLLDQLLAEIQQQQSVGA